MLDIPPPPAVYSSPAERMVEIVTFEPERIVCGSREIDGSGVVQPFTTVLSRYGSQPVPPPPPAYELSFAIDSGGRPHLIRRVGTGTYPGGFIDTSDLAPSLASSRFPGGAAQDACTISYRVKTTPLSSAPMPALYELASRPSFSGGVPELWDRLRPEGADCQRGPGSPHLLNYPAFEKISRPQGTWSWTFLAYDVDKNGKTANVRVLGSSGNEVLDRASVKAMSANRYAPGAGYLGCTYHYYRSGPSGDDSPELPAGTPPDTGELPACRIDPKTIRSLLDGNAYPLPFSRRRIAGVAAVSYDTAPWGAIGNVKVIASEPADAFGEAARSAVANARVVESETGYRGCVRRVRFKLPSEPTTQAEASN